VRRKIGDEDTSLVSVKSNQVFPVIVLFILVIFVLIFILVIFVLIFILVIFVLIFILVIFVLIFISYFFYYRGGGGRSAGVAQGGILSPTLYNIYCHDLPSPTDAFLSNYPDDTMIATQHRRDLNSPTFKTTIIHKTYKYLFVLPLCNAH
jgi:energy-coupling factor transporter transmembrane protein EcfT